MAGRVMTMDATADRSSTDRSSIATAERPISASWSGVESPWEVAARAAAPWPMWSLVAAFGIPGPAHVPAWIQGALALSAVFTLMVLWAHRPERRALMRWIPAAIGTGLMGELLANALTDMGRAQGLSELADAPRALVVLLLCGAVYEIAPIVAATSRLTPRERRWRSLDVGAYLAFALLAAGAYVWDPIHDGALWRMSPWMAVVIAFPFAAARCGVDREMPLPSPKVRGGVYYGLAILGWAILIAVVAADWPSLSRGVWRLRWGAQPLEGVLGVLPALSLVLSLFASVILFARAWVVRHAPHGSVADTGDGGFTLDRAGIEEPTWVALDGGPMPVDGTVVTLLGARRRSPDAGPFRDGAPRLRARRAWEGTPRELARILSHRAAAWATWAAVSGLGVAFQLW
jgi:hypothetical protein